MYMYLNAHAESQHWPMALSSTCSLKRVCLRTVVAVVVPDVPSCYHLPVYNVTQQSGYLSSSVTKTSSCGTMVSPWQLSAKPGQTINISLLDFSASNVYDGGDYVYYAPVVSAIIGLHIQVLRYDGHPTEPPCKHTDVTDRIIQIKRTYMCSPRVGHI